MGTMTSIYDRKQKKIISVKHFGGKALGIIYRSRILTWIVTCSFVSFLYGLYQGSFLSRGKIQKFILENRISMEKYEKKEYSSFTDFFIRKLKKISFDSHPKHLTSPVEGYLLCYPVSSDLSFSVKNHLYTLDELLEGEDVSSYQKGMVFVFRLVLSNYHRFHYIDDGKRIKRKVIPGRLHTMSDSSKNYKIFKENYREYSILKTNNLGEMIYMEVGALLVGKIHNHDLDSFQRGEEKGYFLPGGSTVILIMNHVQVDSDILKYSQKGIETKVDVGERIGVLK
ncbi:MAG: phosphatidylserine decarboxylase [Bacilli bacterium]|nr:phosphatidylserine decarboxylase [Bacilli bacterium]